MAQKSAELAGQVAQIHPQLASKMRDHWMQNNESHTQYMERMAEELGAIYKAVGNKSTMTIPGQNPDGSSGATLYAHWGDNLIGMRASLYIARSTYEGTSSQSYDHEKAQWGFDALKFGSGLATGQEQSTAQTGPAPSPSVGSQQNTGSGNEADMTIGEGRIVINGEPAGQTAR